jgi:hypothetical protein
MITSFTDGCVLLLRSIAALLLRSTAALLLPPLRCYPYYVACR